MMYGANNRIYYQSETSVSRKPGIQLDFDFISFKDPLIACIRVKKTIWYLEKFVYISTMLKSRSSVYPVRDLDLDAQSEYSKWCNVFTKYNEQIDRIQQDYLESW